SPLSLCFLTAGAAPSAAPGGTAADLPNSFSAIVYILLHLHKLFKSFIANNFPLGHFLLLNCS
ncbi:hypothetical protein, partial [Ruminococcus sp.]|uniref:hypothetical protein n=1 Tax=Ruminococcus sp. TaxID=41978 RepID=UPI0025CF47E8